MAITDKILLTNCHVIAGRAQISVSQDGATSRAKLIYGDPGGDRCFLQVDGMVLHPVQGVRRANDLRIGETVYSVGTPPGWSAVSAKVWYRDCANGKACASCRIRRPSWYGSSGGGLFDSRGNLVGITTAISAVAANMSFSIAAEDFWP